MITEAKVISTDGKYAVVESERKSACDGCHKNKDGNGCSICSLTGGNRIISLRAYNTIGAKAGDTVAISTGTGRVLGYAGMVFLMPIIIAVAGWLIGAVWLKNETIGSVLALAGIVISFAGTWLYSQLVVKKRTDAEIVTIIKKNDDAV